MNPRSGVLVLPSGRTIHAKGGLVSIGEDLEISQGAQGPLAISEDLWEQELFYALSPTDAVMLAGMMIARWEKFKAKWLVAGTPQ